MKLSFISPTLNLEQHNNLSIERLFDEHSRLFAAGDGQR